MLQILRFAFFFYFFLFFRIYRFWTYFVAVDHCFESMLNCNIYIIPVSSTSGLI